MKKQFSLFCLLLVVGTTLFQSCKKDEGSTLPPQVGIFYSVVDKQAAFTALTIGIDKWSWEFGDGQTSTEKNPVHVYKEGGYYKVTLVGTDSKGSTLTSSATAAVSLTPFALLTGDYTATGYDGKKWKLSATYSGDIFANADADFSIVEGPLPPGIFGNLGLVEIYDDTYTFYHDGKYVHDVKSDGASFGGVVNQMISNGGAGIVNPGPGYGLCTGKYTPQTSATFTFVEKENFAMPSVYGTDGIITYNGVSTLDFSGTEFIGFLDYQRKVIVQEVTDSSMRLVVFMAASPDYFPANTHALILTFDVVK
jgi:PKD repeat protein